MPDHLDTSEAPQAAPRTAVAEAPHAATTRPRILVVDDDDSLLRFVRILLSGTYDVETASDGLSALEKAAARKPDLIVLDLRMPVMDGRDVYKKLRSDGIDSKVLILSAYGADQAQSELGAEACLAKPFDPENLLAVVEEVLA